MPARALGTFPGCVSLSVPCCWGCLGTLWFSQALAKGICSAATPGVGQPSDRNGACTEVAPKSPCSSRAGHTGQLLPPKQQPAARLPWLPGTRISCSPSLASPPPICSPQSVSSSPRRVSGQCCCAISVQWIWLRLGAGKMPHAGVVSSQPPFPSRISDLRFS